MRRRMWKRRKTSSYTHQPTHTHAAWKMIVDEIHRYKFLLIPEERKQTLFHTRTHTYTHNHYTTQRKRMRPYTVAFISKILSSCHAHALTFTVRRKSKRKKRIACRLHASVCMYVCVWYVGILNIEKNASISMLHCWMHASTHTEAHRYKHILALAHLCIKKGHCGLGENRGNHG